MTNENTPVNTQTSRISLTFTAMIILALVSTAVGAVYRFTQVYEPAKEMLYIWISYGVLYLALGSRFFNSNEEFRKDLCILRFRWFNGKSLVKRRLLGLLQLAIYGVGTISFPIYTILITKALIKKHFSDMISMGSVEEIYPAPAAMPLVLLAIMAPIAAWHWVRSGVQVKVSE